MRIKLTLMAGALLLMGGISFAHEGHGHADEQMAKLHQIMPRYAAAQATINMALNKGDTGMVAKEADDILLTTADLKKSKPHKRVDQIKEFRRIAGHFEKDIRATSELAREGDLEAAKKSFANAERQCTACHRKFRD
jgi:hypothetical protein